jgi:hypothetical protein
MTTLPNEFSLRGLAPGVRFDETVPGKQTAFKTGIPLFIGFAETTGQGDGQRLSGSGAMLHRFTGFEQFSQCLHPRLADGYLDYAVRGFFDNGGEACLVVSLDKTGEGVYALGRSIEALYEPIQGGALEDVVDIDLVCVPDIMMKAFRATAGMVARLQRWMLAYCRHMEDRFAILDCEPAGSTQPGKMNTRQTSPGQKPAVDQALAHRQLLTRHGALDSVPVGTPGRQPIAEPVDGALYFPWLCVKPLPRHRPNQWVMVPPSGHIAGIYARSDAMYGVHKAPANEMVKGVEDLEIDVSDPYQAALNGRNINCLRSFPGRGIRVWGARTLSQRPSGKYVNMRRMFLTLARWIERHMKEMAFEPNTPALWHRVSDRLGAYCYQLYNQGALKGTHPAEAFFVKCDAETNPMESRAIGRLVCDVGLAPVKPAEFIVLRITQSASGTTVFEPEAPQRLLG